MSFCVSVNEIPPVCLKMADIALLIDVYELVIRDMLFDSRKRSISSQADPLSCVGLPCYNVFELYSFAESRQELRIDNE